MSDEKKPAEGEDGTEAVTKAISQSVERVRIACDIIDAINATQVAHDKGHVDKRMTEVLTTCALVSLHLVTTNPRAFAEAVVALHEAEQHAGQLLEKLGQLRDKTENAETDASGFTPLTTVIERGH